VVPGQIRQGISKAPFQPITGAWWHVPVIPTTREAKNRKITWSLGSSRQKHKVLLKKIAKAKKKKSCEVVKQLPSKDEDLNSKPQCHQINHK
jgi:hypothetical protein